MTEQHRLEEEAIDQSSDELEKLEEDVKNMAQKIAEFRDTLPDHLHNTLSSILTAQRPTLHLNLFHHSPGPSSSIPDPDSRALVVDDHHDLVFVEKIQTIKQKISDKKFAMASLLKRMKDCISRIDKMDSFNKGIHPAFKRRKTTSKDCFM